MPFARRELSHPEPLVDCGSSGRAGSGRCRRPRSSSASRCSGRRSRSRRSRAPTRPSRATDSARRPAASPSSSVATCCRWPWARACSTSRAAHGHARGHGRGGPARRRGYLMFLPFHASLAQTMTNMVVAGARLGCARRRAPRRRGRAGAPHAHGLTTGMTNTTKTIGGAFASSASPIALARPARSMPRRPRTRRCPATSSSGPSAASRRSSRPCFLAVVQDAPRTTRPAAV